MSVTTRARSEDSLSTQDPERLSLDVSARKHAGSRAKVRPTKCDPETRPDPRARQADTRDPRARDRDRPREEGSGRGQGTRVEVSPRAAR
eukprot:2126425-Prymnesium_polylepis.1